MDIDDIVPDPNNCRRRFGGIPELALSIRNLGIVDPPVVVRLAGERLYRLLSGERRWRAAKLAGQDAIVVVVIDGGADNSRLRARALVSNLQRQPLGLFELADALLALRSDQESAFRTNRELGAALGKSEQWIGQMLHIGAIPRAIRDVLDGSPVPISTDVASHIARTHDYDKQLSLAEEATKGCSVRDIRTKAKGGTARKRATLPGQRRTVKFEGGWIVIHRQGETDSYAEDIRALESCIMVLQSCSS